MPRPDHTSPFDHEHEPESDLTQEFWGVDRRDGRWGAHDGRPSQRIRRGDDTGSIRALRDGVAAFRPQRGELRDPTGQIRRTRAHGAPRAATASASESRANATIGDLAAGHYDDTFDHRDQSNHDLPLTSVVPTRSGAGFGALDPLLVRLGVLLLVGVLLVPVALALRSSSDDQPDSFEIDAPTEQVGVAAGAGPDAGIAPTDADPSAGGDSGGMPTAASQPQGAAATSEFTAAAVSTSDAAGSGTASAAMSSGPGSNDPDSNDPDSRGSAEVGDVAQSVETGIADPATADETAERIIPECLQTYAAVPGDSWYGIADRAGVSPTALMAENRATVDTVILAGDDVCLPSGATVPTAPPTTMAAETTRPETTAAPTTTDAPSTTVAPTTPSGSPGTNASVAEVKDVIRSIFPESEWETAFMIAERESHFVPAAYNGWCCYGVFQIYWSVHRGWLGDFGIDSSDDLFDPLLNVRAAHAIWQRSGNTWTAWSTYDG